MYIINGKSVTGPNRTPCQRHGLSLLFTYPGGNAAAATASRASNQYQFQLEQASLVSGTVPKEDDLQHLTRIVATDNLYNAETPGDPGDEFHRAHIKHVIYIVKENRTFRSDPWRSPYGSNAIRRWRFSARTSRQTITHCAPVRHAR